MHFSSVQLKSNLMSYVIEMPQMLINTQGILWLAVRGSGVFICFVDIVLKIDRFIKVCHQHPLLEFFFF